MKYEWAEGRGRSVPALVVGNQLEKIAAKHGGQITPGAFVAAAKGPRSPLHRLFEWDDTKAARAHRLHQARMIINSIDVLVDEHESTRVQAFVSVRHVGGRRYLAHAQIANDDELYEQVIDELRGVVASYRRKLAGFERFRDLIQAIEDAA